MKNLISPDELAGLKDPVILDARFRLQDPSAAERLYQESHIPGASRVDLDHDLSGAKTGRNGRHPIPERHALLALFSRLGIGPASSVVAYDDTDHAGAARLWFLLRWMGYEDVRVLHGGLKAWAEKFPLERGNGPADKPTAFREGRPLVAIVERERLSGNLVDVRARERFLGEVEPLDPRAGHIPGARNLPYVTLFGKDGRFLEIEQLRKRMGEAGPAPTFYCGSGVTACVPLLVAQELGLEAKIYPGSWSEWSQQPDAAVETGEAR